MRVTKLIRHLLSAQNRVAYAFTTGVVVFLVAIMLLAQPTPQPDLKVLKMGLGLGRIVSTSAPGIDCGGDCDEPYASGLSITIEARADAGSRFVRWEGDVVGSATANPTTVTMSGARALRAIFDAIPPGTTTTAIPTLTDFTPEGISSYLQNSDAAQVNSPARFIAALPRDFRQNWILMSRSESLQTGIASSPRILLPSADARFVFTVGMTENSSYPGAHHNAIEFMQWDPIKKNFRFHEIVLDTINAMGDTLPDGTRRFPRRTRGISIDDEKCSKCHSTRNVLNIVRPDILEVTRPVTAAPSAGPYPATDGVPPGSVLSKNKPNWDAYDSWGGMMPFNRDRIYQGSLEAAAFRHLFNLWNWRNNDEVRQIIELLELQPPHVAGSNHNITRDINSTADDSHIIFGFDGLPVEPTTTSPSIGYSFGRPSETPTTVPQGGRYVTLRHSDPRPSPAPNTFNDAYTRPALDEGRAVQLFDLLGGGDGTLNQRRVADELVNHEYATGNFGPIDIRPIAMAISKGTCLQINTTTNTVTSAPRMAPDPDLPALVINDSFFNTRNGMNVTQVRDDTKTRWAPATASTAEVPATRSTNFLRRKADIQKLNLDRTGDPYLFSTTPHIGLIQQYGGTTSADTSVNRLRQEVFRRPFDRIYLGDATVMGGIYIDREQYGYNTDRVALYRYFLEPLGVSVDKWSMGVRGRSRTYNFADVFASYANVIEPELRASLMRRPAPGLSVPPNPDDCAQLINAVNRTLSSLPDPNAVPNFTDIQLIFNKSCIECHGGLGYPPYGPRGLNLSEDERPAATNPRMMSPRLFHSYETALGYIGPGMVPGVPGEPVRGYLYDLITRTNEDCPPGAVGLMPCGGPALSKVDIETIRRWIDPPGEPPSTTGDPHIRTINGIAYDFQSAGEFVLLRDEYLEIQARQTAVETNGPLAPHPHTLLSSCVSLNNAVAVRMGQHRITYQPNVSGDPDPSGLQLRIDGKLTNMSDQELLLPSGGRIIRTTAPGGIQIEGAAGTAVIITPGWWPDYQVWHLNIEAPHARATQGVMGTIAPGNWLPALPDGSSMGPRPGDSHQRYLDLYDKFENAWRVTDATTLFDYAPGTSTATFAVDSWPAENPQVCTAPPRTPGGPVEKPPLKTLPLEVAQQLCSALVAADWKANCVQDVMITGEPGFAKTYLLTEQIARNAHPTAPVLGFPEDNQIDLDQPITFTWNNSTDSDGDQIRYRQCVWVTGDSVSFKDCDAPSSQTTSGGRRMPYALLAALLVCLLLAILIFMVKKQRRVVLALIAIVIVAGIIFAFYLRRTHISSGLASKTVSTLKPGETYLWKVIAEDGKGGTTESKTRRFTTK